MEQLLFSLCVGGLLGLAGQAIRAVVGIKKTFDNPEVTVKNFSENFEGKRFFISLLIGFTAGMLTILLVDHTQYKEAMPPNEIISGIIAAGYSGTDFIEGFIRKKVPLQ